MFSVEFCWYGNKQTTLRGVKDVSYEKLPWPDIILRTINMA